MGWSGGRGAPVKGRWGGVRDYGGRWRIVACCRRKSCSTVADSSERLSRSLEVMPHFVSPNILMSGGRQGELDFRTGNGDGNGNGNRRERTLKFGLLETSRW